MKYLAILKDSLREALDSKVLYVLFALSTLSIIVVAMLSFKPLTAEKTMQQFFGHELWLSLNMRKLEHLEARGGRPVPFDGSFRLVSVKLLRGQENAPEAIMN